MPPWTQHDFSQPTQSVPNSVRIRLSGRKILQDGVALMDIMGCEPDTTFTAFGVGLAHAAVVRSYLQCGLGVPEGCAGVSRRV